MKESIIDGANKVSIRIKLIMSVFKEKRIHNDTSKNLRLR